MVPSRPRRRLFAFAQQVDEDVGGAVVAEGDHVLEQDAQGHVAPGAEQGFFVADAARGAHGNLRLQRIQAVLHIVKGAQENRGLDQAGALVDQRLAIGDEGFAGRGIADGAGGCHAVLRFEGADEFIGQHGEAFFRHLMMIVL